VSPFPLVPEIGKLATLAAVIGGTVETVSGGAMVSLVTVRVAGAEVFAALESVADTVSEPSVRLDTSSEITTLPLVPTTPCPFARLPSESVTTTAAVRPASPFTVTL